MPIRKNKLILLLGVICLEQGKSVTVSVSPAPNCGQSLVKVQPWNNFNIFSRILGGSQVEKGSYPWQVSLKQRQKHICGGTIISPQWVITAAHCVSYRNTVSTVNVTAGEHDLSQTEPEEQTLTIQSVIVHPLFSSKKPMDYDIALLKMAGAFQFGQFVGPMCLPEPGEQFEAGFICTTAGWGRLGEDGVLPQVLQEVNLPILTHKECMAALSSLKKFLSGKTFLCTGFPEGGRDACQGDSGGSLMCQNKKGAWTLAGVTSWGLGCGRSWRNNMHQSDPGSPGIFTDLSKVLPWIREHIQTGHRRKSSRDSGCSVITVLFEEGFIQSPNYPGNYSDMASCNWIFQAPKHHLIELSFQSLEIEESGDCTSDYVTVHSDVERRTEIARLCGYMVPSPVLSPSSVLLISFQSDENRTCSGFQATVAFIPKADVNISTDLEDESMFLETWNVPT
ncbi:ovochymase-2 isoform X8 [Lemur catta]|uniref:ovochymase-2 isoform X8 n=1 Tax=Lemur catta TaxID=9447 RepID=UPI001E268B2E|nr:ovochymase-2 isoform X8 [Lemur catta]